MKFWTVAVIAVALLVAGSLGAEMPLIVGEHVSLDLETPHPYAGSGSATPEVTWADVVSFPDATYIAVHFARMNLGNGDYVVVRSPDGNQSWTYTGAGRQGLGLTPDGFFATHIKGDTAIIELYASGAGGWGYAIDKFGRGYSDEELDWYWSMGLGEEMNLARPDGDNFESLCGADDTDEAKCYMDTEPEIYNQARAVARLLLNGSAHCTGWLVGNAGHLMTNEHCIGSQSSLNNIDFEFDAEGADCATNCASTLACPGTIEASGGTLVAVDSALDYSLVIPDTSTGTGTDLPSVYGFMKLRATGAVLDERVYHPQHPAGWGKQIGVNSTYPADVDMGGYCYASSLTETPCSGGTADVGYWTDTQGGSSGSPVLAYSDHKVVALHHCRGSAYCSSGNPDSDDRNRGVPIQDVIASLGDLVPPGALCDPFDGPATLQASAVGDNQIDLAWDAVGTPGALYTVKRAIGGCPQADYQTIATGLATNSYSDTTVSGGFTYAYIVVAVDSENCESDPSPCADAAATGPCIEPPTFDGLEAVVNPQNIDCSLELAWSAATPFCGSAVSYTVYRSETPGFTPGPENVLASCVNATSYIDEDVDTQVFYNYIVRAEDDTSDGSGQCNSGNEDPNLVEFSAAATGPDVLFFAEDFDSDDGGLTGSLDWEWGNAYAFTGATCSSTPSPPPAPHSGVGMWGTVLNDCYSNLGNNTGYDTCDNTSPGDDSVLSFQVDLTSTGSAQMCWWEWPDLYLNWDWGQVYANGDVIFEHCGGSYTAPTEWEQQCVDLSSYGGGLVDIEFHMMASGVVNYAGWYIDGLEIFHGSDCRTDEIFMDGFESGDISLWWRSAP